MEGGAALQRGWSPHDLTESRHGEEGVAPEFLTPSGAQEVTEKRIGG